MNGLITGFPERPHGRSQRDDSSLPEFNDVCLDFGLDALKPFLKELIPAQQFNVGHACQRRHASPLVGASRHATQSGQHGWADAWAAQPPCIRNAGYLHICGMSPVELGQDGFSHPGWEEIERKRLVRGYLALHQVSLDCHGSGQSWPRCGGSFSLYLWIAVALTEITFGESLPRSEPLGRC